jgi:hypothetical protein
LRLRLDVDVAGVDVAGVDASEIDVSLYVVVLVRASGVYGTHVCPQINMTFDVVLFLGLEIRVFLLHSGPPFELLELAH